MVTRRTISTKPVTQPAGPIPPAPQPPVNTVPLATSTYINTAKQFINNAQGGGSSTPIFIVKDNDSTMVNTTLWCSHGYLQVVASSNVIMTGNSTSKLTLTGSPTNLNKVLNGLWYVPYLDFTGSDTISMRTSDGSAIDMDTVAITVTGVAPPPPAPGPAPVNTVPSTQAINAPATSVTLSGSAKVSIADADSTSLTTILKASNGKITITNTSGGANINNNGTGLVTLKGTVAQINFALDGMVYTPVSTFTGIATITVETTDGSSTDTDSFNITVSTGSTPAPAPGPASAPFYPFGSRLDLVNGKYPYGIYVSDRLNADMDADLKNKYIEWRNARIYNTPFLTGGKAVKFTDANYPYTSNKLTVSEGMGYGMVLAAFFCDQDTFDGLLTLYRGRPAYAIPAGYANANLYLMDWAIGPNGESAGYGEGWPAGDGDISAAFGMMLAERNFKNTGGTKWNYSLEAQRTIGAIKAWEYKANGTPQGGPAGDVSRPSDYMHGMIRPFDWKTNDTFWIGTAIPRMIAIVERCQTVFSAANGGPGCFVPDGVVNVDGSRAGMTLGSNKDGSVPGNVTNFAAAFGLTGTTYGSGLNNFTPSPGGQLDFTPTEMHHYVNAMRCPQWWGNDYMWSGNASLKTQCQRIVNYIKQATGGNPANMQVGYRMNAGLQGPQGGGINMGQPWPPREMVAALGCAGMVDSAHQSWVNACYTYLVNNWTVNYYTSELMLMGMIALSGNWWTVPGAPQTTSITNVYPSAQSTAISTLLSFGSATGNALSLLYSGTKPVTSTLAVSHGTIHMGPSGTIDPTIYGTITGNDSANVSVSGSLTQVNSALGIVKYTPTSSYSGSDTLSMVSTDNTVSDTDSVTITVGTTAPPPAPPAGSTGYDVLMKYFTTNGNQGAWLDADAVTRFETTATSGVPLTGSGQLFGRWKDRSGRNHDFVESDNTSRPTYAEDSGGPHANIYHGASIPGAGGSTSEFYICIIGNPRSYYGTYISDASGNTGMYLAHDADQSGQETWSGAPPPKGDLILSVGTGTSRKEIRVGTLAGFPASAPYTMFPNTNHIFECWLTGGNISVRFDKGEIGTTPLGASAMAQGLPNMMLCARDSSNTDLGGGNYFDVIVIKNACPLSVERDLITTWVAAGASITGSAPTPIDAQAAINAASAGATLDMTNRTYSGAITINKALTIIGLQISSSTAQTIITVTASNVTLNGLTVTGPQGATYDAAAIGIDAHGASDASRITGLKIQNCTIKNFGNSGISTNFCNNFQITGNTIQDIVYDGMMLLSCNSGGSTGLVQNNIVQRIGVTGSSANSGNAYGIAMSHSTGAPRSQDVTVDNNLVEDVPTWQGLDTHGGLRISFTNNRVRGCWRAVFLTWRDTGNNDCVVSGNRLEAPVTNDRWSVQLVSSTNCTVTNNNMIGWDNGTAVLQQDCVNTTISGNFTTP